jgi:hypothetical protein
MADLAVGRVVDGRTLTRLQLIQLLNTARPVPQDPSEFLAGVTAVHHAAHVYFEDELQSGYPPVRS